MTSMFDAYLSFVSSNLRDLILSLAFWFLITNIISVGTILILKGFLEERNIIGKKTLNILILTLLVLPLVLSIIGSFIPDMQFYRSLELQSNYGLGLDEVRTIAVEKGTGLSYSSYYLFNILDGIRSIFLVVFSLLGFICLIALVCNLALTIYTGTDSGDYCIDDISKTDIFYSTLLATILNIVFVPIFGILYYALPDFKTAVFIYVVGTVGLPNLIGG